MERRILWMRYPPPRPHGRADIVNAGDVSTLQFAFQCQVEIRYIDADEDVGALAVKTRQQVSPDSEDARQFIEQAVQPDDADLVHVKKQFTTASAIPGPPTQRSGCRGNGI